jgi:hypothetical protein
VNVATVAVDQAPAGARGEHVQDGRAQQRGRLHDQQRLHERDLALPCVHAECEHQKVAWDGYGDAGLLNQDEDEPGQHAVMVKERLQG